MRSFFAYLKTKWKVFAMLLLFCALFTLVFSLYSLPVAAVGYAALLCAFFSVVYLSADYRAFRRKHVRLRSLISEAASSLGSLPDPDGQPEADYQELLRALEKNRLGLEARMSRKVADLAEYYTVWAHQIKTPIAAMDLLLQGDDTPRSRQLASELLRIEQYVEMVLCYLRLDSETTDYVIRSCELDAVIRQAVRKYAPQFIRKKIRLEYEPVSCRVLTDEKWLLFVIEQVLSNALKYTRAGSIAISLEAPKTLCIRDTGIGIAPEDLPRVFDKGFTGYNGRTDKKATGIGLYLCRRILTKLGHTISIRSAVDTGTEVRIGLDTAKLTVE